MMAEASKDRSASNPVSCERLIAANGRPLFGLRDGPISDIRLDGFRLHGQKKVSHAKNEFMKDFRLKKWQFCGISAPDFIMGTAVVDIGYLSNAFSYLFDRESGSVTEYSANQALGARTSFEASPVEGEISFKSGQSSIIMLNKADLIALNVSIPGKIEAELQFERDLKPLSIVTRVGLSGFSYTNKEASLSVGGEVSVGERSYKIIQGSPMGIVDYSYGFLGRHTFWNWASAAGRLSSGHRVGINLVQGVNETGYTENAFWLDGKLYKVDVVDFSYDDLDPLSIWKVSSNDGSVDLEFQPLGQRDSDVNLGFVSSRFRQPFGVWSGRLIAAGKAVSVDGLPGFVEEHESIW